MTVVDRWMFCEYRSHRTNLAICRLFYLAAVFLFYLPHNRWLLVTPDAFFNPPPSIAACFPGFPLAWVYLLLNACMFTSASLLLAGISEVWSGWATCVCMLLLNSWAYSVGKINHDHLFMFLPLIMAGSGWAGNQHNRSGCRISLMATMFSLSMFSAGWPKLRTGWLSWEIQSTYGHLLGQYWVAGCKTAASTFLLTYAPPWFWEFADYVGVWMEILFLFLLFKRSTFRIMIAVACVFHGMVWLIFDIGFVSSYFVYALFVDWRRIGIRLPEWLLTRPYRLLPLAWGIVAGKSLLPELVSTSITGWIGSGIIVIGATGGATYLGYRVASMLGFIRG